MNKLTQNNYRRIRLLIGSLGMLLPVVLPIFQWLLTTIKGDDLDVFLPSISHYNYSYASVAFTGILMSFGLLLVSYKGFKDDVQWIKDDMLSSTAGILAIIVSLVPTKFEGRSLIKTPNYHEETWLTSIHLGCAGVFLILLGIMAIFKFTKSKNTDIFHTRRKRFYRICGWIVIVSILLLCGLFLIEYFSESKFELGYAVIIFETISLFAFGLAWLLKGKASFFLPLGLISRQELEDARYPEKF